MTTANSTLGTRMLGVTLGWVAIAAWVLIHQPGVLFG